MCLSCGISHRSRFIPLMFKSELLSPDYTEASTATEASVRLLRLLRLSSVVSNLSLMRFANDYIPTRLLTDAYAELSELRGTWGTWGPRTSGFCQISYYPVQTRKTDYAHHIINCPPDCQSYLRPCYAIAM